MFGTLIVIYSEIITSTLSSIMRKIEFDISKLPIAIHQTQNLNMPSLF